MKMRRKSDNSEAKTIINTIYLYYIYICIYYNKIGVDNSDKTIWQTLNILQSSNATLCIYIWMKVKHFLFCQLIMFHFTILGHFG